MQRRIVLAGLLAMAASAVRATEPDAPKVLATIPADGDLDVDPALNTITVRFDRPMRQSWSFVTKGEATMPAISQPYLADEQTVVAGMVLEPGRDYVVWLNSKRYQNFKDREGRPAAPVKITFRTRLKQG